ncbi:MAG: hypothetical protein HY841_05415 [Bacteroidetes bacterium]|nr:hypothetical protein [Bacteroidota bacterium]
MDPKQNTNGNSFYFERGEDENSATVVTIRNGKRVERGLFVFTPDDLRDIEEIRDQVVAEIRSERDAYAG